MRLPLSVDQVFYLHGLILIGWAVLIFSPRSKWKNAATLAPAVFVAMLYTMIVGKAALLPDPSSPPLDFFSVAGWMAIVREPYMVMGITTHFMVVDLWLGRWMLENFYEKYAASESLAGSLYFKVILLITFMVAPFGFLVYFASVGAFFRRHLLPPEATGEPPIKPEVKKLLDARPVRFGEKLPGGIRQTYYFLTGIVGVGGLILSMLAFLLLVPIALVHYLVYGRSLGRPSTWKPKLSPTFLRTSTAQWRLRVLLVPKSQRGLLWTLAHRLLQLGCFMEVFGSRNGPEALSGALSDKFGSYFPFGDGIGSAARDDVVRILQDPEIRKAPLSLGWPVSTSQRTFSTLTTIFLSSSGETAGDVVAGREMIHEWIQNFVHDAYALTPEARARLDRILPAYDAQPSAKTIYAAFGGMLFFLATGGELRRHERRAYIDAVVNPLIFFPDWFNFLLAGHYMERKGLAGYYTFRSALARYYDGPAMQAAMKVADDHDVPRAEALRFVAIIFSIAGAAAPSTLTEAVVRRLHSDPAKMVALYDKSPERFIVETARLDKGVPLVNVLSREHMTVTIGGQERFIPENTPLHCALPSANRDLDLFGGPDRELSYANTFDPDRENLDKVFVWNGVEGLIGSNDPGRRPPRACPGHDFSIGVVKYLAERYKPILPES